MAGYKEPGFQDRVAAAAQAREKALARLQARPAPDPAVLAERAAKAREREAAQAAKRETAQAERAERKAKREAPPVIVPDSVETASAPEVTEAELKAARDARYAARKARRK